MEIPNKLSRENGGSVSKVTTPRPKDYAYGIMEPHRAHALERKTKQVRPNRLPARIHEEAPR